MKMNNPMDNISARQKMKKRLKEIGHGPKVLGGNGRGYSIPQNLLYKKLGRGWWRELVVKTAEGYKMPYLPTNYKIDLANVYYMLGIECDGSAHRGKKSREEDAKKTAFLEKCGWKMLRFRNKDIMNNTDMVMQEIMSTILRLK